MAFDALVLALLYINALHKPRGVEDKLSEILYNDGIQFFSVSP